MRKTHFFPGVFTMRNTLTPPTFPASKQGEPKIKISLSELYLGEKSLIKTS
jgi:hypothetical protein